MRSLRAQLIASHLALVLILATVLSVGLASILSLGQSVDRILRDNYKSVVAAQQMKESLERLDSSATFCLAGRTTRARAQYNQYLPAFQKALDIEVNNITEPGESELTSHLSRDFTQYRSTLEGLLFGKQIDAEAQRKLYFAELEPRFVNLKSLAQQVLDLNQDAIVRANERAKSAAAKNVTGGIIALLLAVAASLWLAYRGVANVMVPISSLTLRAAEITQGRLLQKLELRRSDEIGQLAEAFNAMADALHEAHTREESRLTRAQHQSEAALNALPIPAMVVDRGGVVVHLNLAAERLFGAAKDVVGANIYEVVSDSQELRSVIQGIEEESQVGRIHISRMLDEEGKAMGAVVTVDHR